jgi:hypothetical protein
MQTLGNFILAIVGIVVLCITVYILAKLVFNAYFREKADYLKSVKEKKDGCS